MDELLARLNQIFSSLVGSRLTFVPLAQLDIELWGVDELAAIAGNATGAPAYVKDQEQRRIGFPVRDRQNGLAGLAIVSDWRLADSKRVFELADFASSLIAHRLSGHDETAERLKRAEEHFALQSAEIRTTAKNVIPLRRTRLPQAEHLWPVPPPPKINAPSLMIQVKPGFPILRFVTEVHDRTERWAFVSLTDLPSDTWESRETFKSLGAITIFVENLKALDLERQKLIASYLRSVPKDDAPLLLVAIEEEPDRLEERGLLDPELRATLVYARMPWNPQDNDTTTVRKSMRLLVDGRPPTADTRFVPFRREMIDDEKPTVH